MSGDERSVELVPGDGVRFEPAEWEARAAAMYRAIEHDADTRSRRCARR
jgi:hypothetical protein